MRSREDILDEIIKEQNSIIEIQEKQIKSLTKNGGVILCLSLLLMTTLLLYLILTHGEPSIVEAIAVRIGGAW